MSDVTGASSMELQPAQPSELLQQLNKAARAVPMWPWVLGATLIGSIFVPWLLIAGIPLIVWLVWRDTVRRTVVIFYEVDGPSHHRYQTMVDAFESAQRSQRAWHTVTAGAVRTTYQFKMNAGASSIVGRENLARSVTPKPNIKTNIAVPTLRSRKRTTYLLPDRMLIKDGNTYTEAHYRSLHVTQHNQRFIETGPVPTDSRQVDVTWKYVNKKGGPDRRFKDNHQIPVMQYGHVDIDTPAGLNLLWSFSNVAAAQQFAQALVLMGS